VCYFISDETLSVEADCVKGAHNHSAVQQHQIAERNSRGSSLQIYFHKCSTKPQDQQLKTTSAAARTRVSRSNFSATRTTCKSEFVSQRSPASRQLSVNNPVTSQADRMETAPVSTSVSGKQTDGAAVESRRASRHHNISDDRAYEKKQRGNHIDRRKMNRSVSAAACSERSSKIDNDSGPSQVNKLPSYTGRCHHQCQHQVSISVVHVSTAFVSA